MLLLHGGGSKCVSPAYTTKPPACSDPGCVLWACEANKSAIVIRGRRDVRVSKGRGLIILLQLLVLLALLLKLLLIIMAMVMVLLALVGASGHATPVSCCQGRPASQARRRRTTPAQTIARGARAGPQNQSKTQACWLGPVHPAFCSTRAATQGASRLPPLRTV